MKNIFKTLLIFLFFIVSLVMFSNCETKNIPAQNYIQNNYPKIVLVSQNISSGEISASKNNSNSIFGDNSLILLNKELINNSFEKNQPVLAANIHNLSTYLTSEISIRAP